jgi:hypothetical protein
MNETHFGPRLFTCRALSVHFLYSFMTSPLDASDSRTLVERFRGVPLHLSNQADEGGTAADRVRGGSVQDYGSRLCRVDNELQWGPIIQQDGSQDGLAGVGLPPGRYGAAPHLRLAADSTWFRTRPRGVAVAGDNRILEGSVRAGIRHFAAGATCAVRVDLGGGPTVGLTTDDVLTVLKLAGEQGKLSRGADDGTHLCTAPGSQPETMYSRVATIIREYCQAIEHSWVDTADPPLLEDGEAPQNPWVVTVAEVDGEIAEAFCSGSSDELRGADSKMLRTRRYEPDIADIVYRSIANRLELEPAYLSAPEGGSLAGLFSSNVDARLFVCMSRRSILCICRDQSQDPAAYFVPALLDICENVRARWHALVATNRVLDRAILDFAYLRGTPVERRETKSRIQLMLAHALEDPTMYIVAGDALSRFHTALEEVLSVDKLSAALFKKLDLATRIYTDARELAWIRHGELEK